MIRRTIGLLVIALLLGSVGGGGWWAWNAWASRAETPSGQRTIPVETGTVEDVVSAVGTLQPRDYVDVGVQVSGQVQVILVDNGDRVEKGQLLSRLDPRVYAARVNAGEAQLLNLKAQARDRQVQQALAERQFVRQQRLREARATSDEAYDTADAARKSLAAQIEAIAAQIKQVESTLEGDRANLGFTQIFAPMAGTVVNVIAKPGQTLNANQQAPLLLRIADLDTMTVNTQVSEADVPRLKIGMDAYFTTLGQPNRRRTGKLRQILPTPEVVNNVVLYPSLFDVDNPKHDLLPQMSAQVFFVVGRAENVPLVPLSAIKRVPRTRNQFTVMVVAGGATVERTIEIGVNNRVMAEVKSGLKAGEEIVPGDAGGRQRQQVPSWARSPRL
jgi:membrane fusion protein, macrolide-specific efflux system